LSASFESTARIPTLYASFRTFSSACPVNRTIFVIGETATIFRAASKPFITGIKRSRTKRSGLSCCTRETPASPSSASPQTCQSVCDSMNKRTRYRIEELSSTMATFGDTVSRILRRACSGETLVKLERSANPAETVVCPTKKCTFQPHSHEWRTNSTALETCARLPQEFEQSGAKGGLCFTDLPNLVRRKP